MAGEEIEEGPRFLRADGRDAGEAWSDVYLNDSFEASDAIATATRLADAGRWKKAAGRLQSTLVSAGDKLVRISPGYYVGVRGYISDIVCAWPEEGLAAYRYLFEREFLSALEQALSSQPLPFRRSAIPNPKSAIDEALTTGPMGKSVPSPGWRPVPQGGQPIPQLLALFDRYFCTSGAAKLADTIGLLAIEAGDLALARRAYQRVLDRHPDRSAYAPRYKAMLALLSVMRGHAQIETIATDKDAMIRWQGADRALGDVLEEVRGSFVALRGKGAPADWPIFAGDATRNRHTASAVDELGLLWRSDVFKPANRVDEEEDTYGGSYRADQDQARHLSIQPVVHGELVFAQRYREVAAIHRNTGVVAWRFRVESSHVSAYEDLDERPPGWDSITVHDGCVYAALPGDVVPYYGYESPQSPPELVCLEASTGEVIWRSDREELSERPSELGFDSTPVVNNGRLYVIGRRRRSFGFEDCYLYCLNAANGRMMFRTHLGSASTGTFGSRRPTLAMVSLHGDTAFVCTNLGTIAAVSGHTGAVRWLRLYDRDAGDSSGESGLQGRGAYSWTFNPLLLSDDRLIFLPMDSPNVFVLAADDGRILHAVPTEDFADIETLLGVDGDLLCGAGDEVACYDLSNGALTWSESLVGSGSPLGRGTWAGNRIYVPTRTGVSGFRVSDGQRTDMAWEEGGSGGNLVALPNELFVAGRDFVAVYVRKAELWNALRERMAAAPSAPLPALELAEVALRGGEFAEAIEVLDEAVRRAGNFAQTMEPSLQRRFFDDILMFVDVISPRSALDAATLEKLFTYASQCPPDPAAHVQFRFRFARLYEQYDRPDQALRLYQQVLRDRSLRKLRFDRPRERSSPGDTHGSRSRPTPGSETAAQAARTRIASLIGSHGVSIYVTFEDEARRWYQTGLASGDGELLARVVETFPNSAAAPLALIARGEMLAKLNRPHQAARLLARAYHRYPKHVNRPKLIRKIADAYEQSDKPEHAYRWLTKAVREHPGVTTEYQGRSMSFLEYRKRIAGARSKVEPSRPRIVLPLGRPFVREFDGSVSLLVPWFGDDPACRWSRYFVAAEREIRAFDTQTNTEVWAQPLPVQTNAELLIVTEQLALFATLYEVFAVDVATGIRRWSHGHDPVPIDGHFLDWEETDRYRTHALHGDRLVSVRDDGEISCVDVSTGNILWSQTRRPAPVGPVRIGDLWAVYHVVQDDRAVICRIDAATGMWIDATLTQDDHALVELFLALDGQIVVVTTRSLSAYDLESGDRRWRVKLGGPPRAGSLLMDIDALYLSDDGQRLQKISLEDGRLLWQSEQLTGRGADDLTVHVQEGNLIVSTSSSVSAVDEVTGLTLWRGTTPEPARFVERFVTQAYVVAVDIPDELGEPECIAYFYDHRNASGVIPRTGGALKLGKVSDLRTIMAGDGALLVQSGSKILGWRGE